VTSVETDTIHRELGFTEGLGRLELLVGFSLKSHFSTIFCETRLVFARSGDSVTSVKIEAIHWELGSRWRD
jgi:hypothetical protein